VSSSSEARRARRCLGPTVLLLALALAGLGERAEADADLRRMRALEIEASLARGPNLYLVLDPAARRLTIKARGLELDGVDLLAVSRLVFRPLFGDAEAPSLPAPALWTVVEGPGDADRETIAPTTLRPYSAEEEESDAAPVPAKPEGAMEKPSTYRVGLDIGWQLLITDEPPRLDRARRFLAAVKDGWLRLRGEEPAHPPLVALVVATEDARRIHHLFRTDTPILALAAD
jgi:hypothetical protein